MAAASKFNSVVTNPGGTGTTITPTLSTHAAGDVIEIFVSKTGNAGWSAPAGWTIRHQTISPGTASTATVGTLLYRRVLPGDTLPLASPVCNLGATVTRHAIARTIRGADVEGVYLLPEWGATGSTSGTNNPIRPPSVTTPAPEMFVTHYYCQRVATNAPEPTNYTQDQQVITSGTLVTNISERTIADQQTTLSNQDVSPTSGGRWVGMITCVPSPDYPYYRSGSQVFNSNGTSVTPALPAGTTASDNRGNKDLIVLTAQCAGVAPTLNTPGDWTPLPDWSDTTSGGATHVRKWCRLYNGSGDRQVNRTPSGEIFAYLSVYHNAHQSIPTGTSVVQQNASSTTSTFPALPRTGTKATVQATCVADATPTFTAPSGWTERNDSQGVTCADQSFDATGTAASASFTLNSASPTLAGLLEVFSVASVINLILTPASTSLVLTGFAPTIDIDVTVTPDAASLTLTTFAPAIIIPADFPFTNTLDDFNRANGSLGASWGGKLFNSDGALAIDTNLVKGVNAGSNNNQGWNTQVGPDCEVYVEIISSADTNRVLVALRWSALDTDTPDGYAARALGGATNNVLVFRFDNGAATTIATISQIVDDGDWLGLRMAGDVLGVFYKDISVSSNWIQIGEVEDTTYSATGHLGLLLEGDTGRADNFSGGTIGAMTITPASASLTLSTFAPQLQTALTPASTSLTLTTFAPSVTIVVTVPAASLALTTFTPAITILTDFQTAVLDNFNRPDEGPPPSANWTNGFAAILGGTTEPGHSVVDNQLFNDFNDVAQNWWNVRQFGPDCEAYITVTDSTNLASVGLAARLTSISGFSSNGYVVQINATGGGASRAYTIWRIDGTGGEILASDSESGAGSMTGDRYGIRITGSLIEIIGDTGDGPTIKLSVEDSTYTTAGYIGVVTESQPQARWDDFGGGTLNEVLVEIPSGSLTLTTFTVQLREVVSPPSQSLALMTFAPALVQATTPTAASLALTAFVPSIITNTILTPASGALTLTASAPQLREAVTPTAASLSLATFTPTVTATAHVTVTPTNATLTLTGFAPQLREQVAPGATTLTLTTFAPEITVSADITVTPAAQTLTLTGFAPSLQLVLTPATNILSLSTFAPTITISADRTETPTPAALSLTTFIPQLQLVVTPVTATLSLSTSTSLLVLVVRPETVAITLTTFAPVITVGADVTVTPAPVALTLTAFAPTVTTGALVTTITPATATLTLTSYAPWLFLGLVPASRTFVVESGRYEVEVSAGEYEFLDRYEDDEVLVS